ncbi:MAG: serine/threonine protein kinase [Deltaproteobacteria bacterium]|nr:serine/threonine protein kinase [Deltaproteobacteria bacterium]
MGNSPARSVIDVGSVIDKYVIEALIGRGGMGAVFLARHRSLTDKKVAIKVLHAEILDHDIQLRFKREAQIATRVNHPNIVEVHDFDVTPDGVPYLVLEYLEGQTLAQRIAHGPLPLDQAMSILRQVSSALAAAHREGVVHRDLKPQNIFLVPSEVDGRVVEVAKVLDFGISKWRGSETVKTQESALLGTPQYMAPEQATGRHDAVDQRTDIFALGSITYEMLCGGPAFTGASIPEVVFKVVYEQPAPIPSTVPDNVAAAIRKAMSKPSDERFASVSDFVEALTGSALMTFRPSLVTKPPSEIGFASGSKKLANFDALGDTMGSGDYSANAPPTAPSTRPGLAVAPPVLGNAPTVDSVRTRATPTPVVARSGGPQWWILAGIGAIAATVAIMYFVMKRSDSAQQAASPPAADAAVQVAKVTPDAAVVTPGPTKNPNQAAIDKAIADEKAHADFEARIGAKVDAQAKLVDELKAAKLKAAQAAEAAKRQGKQPPPPPDRGMPPPPPPDEGQSEEDEDVRENLQRAKDAYANGDLDLADRLANLVINRGGPRQRVQGARIKGLVACQKKDVELANTALNQLVRSPALRREVIEVCRSRGLDGLR